MCASVTSPMAPPAGGVSIAKVWSDRKALAGKTVTVRGKVVKFNGGILDRNWLHIQDGSGKPADGTHDLAITSDGVAAVGDVVTATGVVAIDKDFTAGYAYKVILEKAQLKKEGVQETCVQCHRKEVNKVHKSSHMPVTEGKMECTTCHNPHGSQNVKMLREGNSINEACASCHTEKRGPFLWEHAVGRENCVTCHDPHGSNNERMLVAKLPMLCQRCHIHSRHPATVYDATQVFNKSNRVAGRSCVNCHQMLHGSNHPTSGKVFLR